MASAVIVKILNRFMMDSVPTRTALTLYPTFNRRPAAAIVSSSVAKDGVKPRYRILLLTL
jgi:hypothetical protein